MIVDAIRSLFGAPPKTSAEPAAPEASPGGESSPTILPDPLHLAACTLLLEVAHADGEFSANERTHLESVLERHFRLPQSAGRRLIELAHEERRRSIDHFQFTSLLSRSYDLGQKMVLAKIMWGLVLADGTVAQHEQYLARKIGNLLGLEPGYLSTARANAARANSSSSSS